MKKYVRGAVCLGWSLLRFWWLKLFHLRGFRFTMLSLISPFAEVEIGHRAGLQLGWMVKIRGGARLRVRAGARVVMGDRSYLNHGCMIVAHENIVLGQGVRLGPNVMVYDHDHDPAHTARHPLAKPQFLTAPVIIGDNVWVGANSVILRGTRIGDNCVIGAGSVIKGHYGNNQLIIQKRDTLAATRGADPRAGPPSEHGEVLHVSLMPQGEA